MSNTKIPAVLWSADQAGSISSADKAIARENIGLTNAVVLKGDATVAQLNGTISDLTTGWQYTLTDAGTLNAGSIPVTAGDKVVWNGSAWEMAGGGGGAYVLFGSHNTTDDTWTWPSATELSDMYDNGIAFLRISKTNGSATTGTLWYVLSSSSIDNTGSNRYVFTGNKNEIAGNNPLAPEQIELIVSQQGSITYNISDTTDIFVLNASHNTQTDTWSWPTKDELSNAYASGKTVILDVVEYNTGATWENVYYLTYHYSLGGTASTYDFTGRRAGLPDGILETISLTASAASTSVSATMEPQHQTHNLYASYDRSTATYSWPTPGEFTKLDNLVNMSGDADGHMLLEYMNVQLVIGANASGAPTQYYNYKLVHHYKPQSSDSRHYYFTGSSNPDAANPVTTCIELYRAYRATALTANVTNIPGPATQYFEATISSSGTHTFPDANAVRQAVDAGRIPIIKALRMYGDDIYTLTEISSGSGNTSYTFSTLSMDINGFAFSKQIQYNTSTGWTYKGGLSTWMDGGYEIMDWSQTGAASQPFHHETHLISAKYGSAASGSITYLYISKLQPGKMYDIHCMWAKHGVTLHNDTGKTWTVYDTRTKTEGTAVVADTPYSLTDNYNIELWGTDNTHSRTCQLLLFAQCIYVTYGY